jgi:hypothetical protein
VPLRDRKRACGAALVEPVAPCAPARRIFDAEEKTILGHLTIVEPIRRKNPSAAGRTRKWEFKQTFQADDARP